MTGKLAESAKGEAQSSAAEMQSAHSETLLGRAQSNSGLRRDHGAGFDMAHSSLLVSAIAWRLTTTSHDGMLTT